MTKTLTGGPPSDDRQIAIVVGQFNSSVTEQLLAGAEAAFLSLGGRKKNLTVIRVPGAFEIPATVKRIAEVGEVDGVLALGAVIKGATHHFEVISTEVTRALMDLTLEQTVPIAFGILTTYTREQAIERASVKGRNKGAEAMRALAELMEMVTSLP